VAAAICEGSELRLPDVGVNPTRTGLLDALEQVGVPLDCGPAKVSWGEPRSDWTVRSGALRPLRIGGAVVPRLIDEIPVLAVLAARCPGVSRFEDVGDLRAKESDRITTTAAMLRAFGVRVEVRDDGFDVHGRPEGPLTGGGVVDACGDHRIAMAAAVAALVADGPTTLQGAGAADTSFPGYFPLLDRCLGRVEDAGSKT
jgi:3-phosphoshikimate 1-carboxyvinyltransferase